MHLGQAFFSGAASAFGDDLTELEISTLISTLESSNPQERSRLRSESEHLAVIVAIQLIRLNIKREATFEENSQSKSCY